MAYKYPICDVFHWFCKIARFFATEPYDTPNLKRLWLYYLTNSICYLTNKIIESSTSPTGSENHLSPLRFQTFNRKVFWNRNEAKWFLDPVGEVLERENRSINLFILLYYLDFVRLDSYSNLCYRFHYEQYLWHTRSNDDALPCNVT
jgi:hypothetical protein